MTAVPFAQTHGLRRSLSLSALLIGLVLAEAAPALQAQRWSERHTLSQRRRAGIAYDLQRDRLLLFGGIQSRGTVFNAAPLRETWEWDGVTWTRRVNILGEPIGTDSTRGMVYDTVNRRVLFINMNSSSLATDFHRWEGRSWQAINATPRPTYRQHFAVAFDELRGKVVLWGGGDSNGPASDVWEFDGTAWTNIGPPGPSGRNDPAMAWDGVRGKVILFGGRDVTTAAPLSDMWEWDGVAQVWNRITPATVPPARNQHTMTWDPERRRVVLFGGGSGLPGTVFDDTWEWDGTNWTRVTTPTTPGPRMGHGATYHVSRRRLIVACGETAADLRADTWEYNGTTWSEVTPQEAPDPRSDHVTSYDAARGQTVLFGGRNAVPQSLNDTWLFQVSSWRRVNPTTSPTPRYDPAMAFDAARGNTVLFGGFAAGGAQNDTWLWDGTNWTLANPAVRPSARYAHGMEYDTARNRIVLFGGSLATGVLLNDTWEWDGTTWQQVTPAASPPARADHGMAYDILRNQMLVAGGRTTATTYVADIWSYDGATTWTNRTPTPNSLAVRGNLGMEYDAVRGLTFAFAGMSSAATFLNTTLNWNGATWNSFFGIGPNARAGHSMTWDAGARRILMFGGEGSGAVKRGDTQVLTYNPQSVVGPPIAAPGCSGQLGAGAISGFGSPSVGNTSFALDLATPDPPPTNSSPVFFFLSQTQNTVMFGPCRLVIDPATLFHIDYRLQRGAFASLPIPIPANINLMSATFFAQCMFISVPSAMNGIAFSQGAQVTIGDYF